MDAFGLAGLVVSIAGWGTAIWQIRRTRKASEAVVAALDEERARSAMARLALLPSRLQASEVDLHRAISDDDRAAAVTAVRECRTCAIEIQSLLDLAGVATDADLSRALVMLLGLVGVCMTDLLDPTLAVGEACETLIARLSVACGLSAGLPITISLGIGGDDP